MPPNEEWRFRLRPVPTLKLRRVTLYLISIQDPKSAMYDGAAYSTRVSHLSAAPPSHVVRACPNWERTPPRSHRLARAYSFFLLRVLSQSRIVLTQSPGPVDRSIATLRLQNLQRPLMTGQRAQTSLHPNTGHFTLRTPL